MSLFTWKPEYSVGSEQIDEQHKKLFKMAEALHIAMVAGTGKGAVPKLLNDLISYTVEHFANEERLMRETSYGHFMAHTAEHSGLRAKVAELQRRMATNDAPLTVEVMHFLSDWLKHHIKESDQKLAAHLKKRERSAALV